MFRPGEHHVLEQMRESGVSGFFVGSAHVIPDVDGNDRQPLIGRQNDLEPVVELVLGERYGRRGCRVRRRRIRRDE